MGRMLMILFSSIVSTANQPLNSVLRQCQYLEDTPERLKIFEKRLNIQCGGQLLTWKESEQNKQRDTAVEAPVELKTQVFVTPAAAMRNIDEHKTILPKISFKSCGKFIGVIKNYEFQPMAEVKSCADVIRIQKNLGIGYLCRESLKNREADAEHPSGKEVSRPCQ